MVASTVRVAARRGVMDAHNERRRLRQERESQLAALAVEVSVALATGRAAIERAELSAGQALDRMLGMGISVAEVVEWCAGDVTAKDIARLRHIAAAHPEAEATDGQPAAEDELGE